MAQGYDGKTLILGQRYWVYTGVVEMTFITKLYVQHAPFLHALSFFQVFPTVSLSPKYLKTKRFRYVSIGKQSQVDTETPPYIRGETFQRRRSLAHYPLSIVTRHKSVTTGTVRPGTFRISRAPRRYQGRTQPAAPRYLRSRDQRPFRGTRQLEIVRF